MRNIRIALIAISQCDMLCGRRARKLSVTTARTRHEGPFHRTTGLIVRALV